MDPIGIIVRLQSGTPMIWWNPTDDDKEEASKIAKDLQGELFYIVR